MAPVAMRSTLILSAFSVCLTHANAASHALLIGIDTYASPTVTKLEAAGADAIGLGKQLTSVGKVPTSNVKVLLSSGAIKPTKKSILDELKALASRVKPGDTVFLSFSGHGVQLQDGEAALVPFDADLRDATSTKESTVSMAAVRQALGRIDADLLVCLYDMCRNDPISGRSTGGNYMGVNLGRAGSATSIAGDGKSGPKNVVSLFSCSPTQISYEWRGKGRGFFSYFVEQGLSGAAADASGQVTVSSLASYLSLAVPGTVQREVGREQTPMFDALGPNVLARVLATGLKPGSGGTTAVPAILPTTKEGKFNVLFQRGYEAAKQGRMLAAEEWFEEALKLNPKSVATMLAAGKAFQLMGNTASAQDWYARALKIDPDSPEAWLYGMACTAFSEGLSRGPFRWKESSELVTKLDRVLKLNQKQPLAWFIAGVLHYGYQARSLSAIRELTPVDSSFRSLLTPSLDSVLAKPDPVGDFIARVVDSDRVWTQSERESIPARLVALARERPDEAAIWGAVARLARRFESPLHDVNFRQYREEADRALLRLGVKIDDVPTATQQLDVVIAKQEMSKVTGIFFVRVSPGSESDFAHWRDVFGPLGWNQANQEPSPKQIIPLGRGNYLQRRTTGYGPNQGILWTALGPTFLYSEMGELAIRYL